MKKLLIFVLVFLLIFAACNDPLTNESSEEESAGASSEYEESSDAKPYVEPANVTAIKELLVGDIDRRQNRANIFAGCSYKCSTIAGSDGYYTDTDNKLTNGIAVEGFDRNNWAGFIKYSSLTIDFDLGEEVQGIADVTVGCLKQLSYGIGLPEYISLSFSNDGTNYVRVATLNRPSLANDNQRYEYGFYLQQSVSARYVRITVGNTGEAFLFIDEISCYVYDINNEGEAAKRSSDYYDDYTIDPSEPVYWDQTDSDYNTYQNLALGKKAYISAFAALLVEKCNSTDNSPSDMLHLVTDGKLAKTPSWSAAETFRMSQGDGRTFIIDLEKISAISAIDIEFVAHTDWGVYVTKEVGISASENGVDWQAIGTISGITHDTNKTNQTIRVGTDFVGTFKARYVKVSFLVSGHRCLTEIMIMGSKAIPADAQTIDPDADIVTKLSDRYIRPSDLLGIENIMLAPICLSSDGVTYNERGDITHDEFLPLVGYYENGAVKDDFMDTFVFSPCAAYTKESDRIRLDGWKFYLESQFMPDHNLDALNQAAKTVGNALGREDFSLNLFVSILRPVGYDAAGKVNSFGDIDGDGIDDSFDVLENRIKAMKWFVDTQLERIEAAGYDRLNMVGFYWHEEVFYSTDFDMDFAAFEYIRDYVQGMGYKLIWIPYYQATHFDEWKDFGFDMACMQPNYAFAYTQEADRLDSTAEQAKLYGMCVELEINTYTNRLNIQRYKEYLEYGVKHGYMNSIKVYYHNTIPSEITLAMQSNDPYTSSVYRDTYLFAKGLLDETYNQKDESIVEYAPEDMQIECPNYICSGTIVADTDQSYIVRIAESPRFGSLELNLNGEFKYTPIWGYKGEDSFSFVLEFVDYISTPAKVEIFVGDHGS